MTKPLADRDRKYREGPVGHVRVRTKAKKKKAEKVTLLDGPHGTLFWTTKKGDRDALHEEAVTIGFDEADFVIYRIAGNLTLSMENHARFVEYCLRSFLPEMDMDHGTTSMEKNMVRGTLQYLEKQAHFCDLKEKERPL